MARVRQLPPDPWGESKKASTRELVSVLIGDRRGTVAWLAFCSIIAGITEAGFLAILLEIAVTLVNKSKQVSQHMGILHLHASTDTLVLIAFVLVISRIALQVPLAVLPARIASNVQGGLRKELFHSFTVASWGMQSREREGHMQETMTGQVASATGGALQATGLITSMFSFLVLLLAAFALNAVAAAIVLVTATLLFAALRPLNQAGVRRARALSRTQMEYAGGIAQANRLAEETRVFGVAGAQREQVNQLIDNARMAFYRTQLMGRLAPSVYQSAISLMLVVGLAILASVGTGHVVSLGAVILLLYRAGSSGQSVQGSWQNLRQCVPFIERLKETKRRYEASSPPEGELALQSIGSLAFEDVSFAYTPGRPVLSNISFEVAGGETVGVIGPSGAGKSTLIQILLRLRQPDEGRYLVNGVPAEEYTFADWHRRVAYVPQEPRLTHATVAENIRFHRDLDDEAIERAGRLARIHDDIMGWPKGYETIVGPRADAVSGGQQQRICLARALAGRPEVLVLDEPTSALDPQSEALIQESLTGLREELTLFIIAHRMSTLDICRRVMVILDGRLVAFDTTDLLREQNAYYRSASALAAGATGARLL
ncbi:MAG TPA: ABC transporter ATP-binding protein [Solirubrobacteraceae bacterium]|nr:ABC transporter ATP-binding protein [Solirubrobacteraceae bacterium]